MSLFRRSDFFALLVPFISAVLLAGCSSEAKRGKFLASVHGNDLRMGDVAPHVDTTSAYAVRNYVSNWVDEHLLYDEAEKLGLNESPQFQQRVKEFSMQLAITMLLNREIYDVPLNLSPRDISAFYDSHRGEFVASGNIAYVNYAGFDKRSVAVAFRNALVSGTPWSSAFSELPAYEIISVKDSVYLKGTDANGAIWNVIQSLDPAKVSFPIQVDSVSYIVQVIDKIGPGDPLPLSFASSGIRERLAIEKRQKMYSALVDSLRSLGNFQVNPSVAIRDTNSQE